MRATCAHQLHVRSALRAAFALGQESAAQAKVSAGVHPSAHGRAGIGVCLGESAFMHNAVKTFAGLLFYVDIRNVVNKHLTSAEL